MTIAYEPRWIFDLDDPTAERPQVVTVPEAAALLGVCETVVLDRIGTGRLSGEKIGRRWLVPLADVTR